MKNNHKSPVLPAALQKTAAVSEKLPDAALSLVFYSLRGLPSDLFNCLLVCKRWYRAALFQLYRDHIHLSNPSSEMFLLHKYGRLIRSFRMLTLYSHSMRALSMLQLHTPNLMSLTLTIHENVLDTMTSALSQLGKLRYLTLMDTIQVTSTPGSPTLSPNLGAGVIAGVGGGGGNTLGLASSGTGGSFYAGYSPRRRSLSSFTRRVFHCLPNLRGIHLISSVGGGGELRKHFDLESALIVAKMKHLRAITLNRVNWNVKIMQALLPAMHLVNSLELGFMGHRKEEQEACFSLLSTVDSLTTEMQGLQNLQRLVLERVIVDEGVFDLFIKSCPNLAHLELKYCDLGESFTESLPQKSFLSFTSFGAERFSARSIYHLLTFYPNLRRIQLYANRVKIIEVDSGRLLSLTASHDCFAPKLTHLHVGPVVLLPGALMVLANWWKQLVSVEAASLRFYNAEEMLQWLGQLPYLEQVKAPDYHHVSQMDLEKIVGPAFPNVRIILDGI